VEGSRRSCHYEHH